jgi:hypothetical protein
MREGIWRGRPVPDVLGMDAEAAVSALEAEGFICEAVETKPPGRLAAAGRLRVVRARLSAEPNRAELIVAAW